MPHQAPARHCIASGPAGDGADHHADDPEDVAVQEHPADQDSCQPGEEAALKRRSRGIVCDDLGFVMEDTGGSLHSGVVTWALPSSLEEGVLSAPAEAERHPKGMRSRGPDWTVSPNRIKPLWKLT